MNDKIVLVTGGAGNLGTVVTRAFLEAGARVAVTFYKTDQPSILDPLAQEFGDRIHSFALDLTTERGAQEAVEQVVEWAGRVDIVAWPGYIERGETDKAFEGQGVGSKVAAFALEDVRRCGLKADPRCPFIAKYIEKHPEYTDLVHPRA